MKQIPSKPFDQSPLSAWKIQPEVPQALDVQQQVPQRECPWLPSPVEPDKRTKALSQRMRRMLQLSWKQFLAGLTLLLALGQGPALASTIFVGGPCTLADAVASANQDLALGGCTTGVGRDSIVLPANSLQTVPTVRPSGLIIRTPITIVGNGSTIRRIGGDSDSRVFTVTASALTLQSVAVSGSDDDDLDGDDDGPGDDDRGRGRGRAAII
jgi:hypothetical protein